MPTAAELLASKSSSDKTLIIDNDLRTIKIPSSITNLGVEKDDDVLRLNFRMPRYLGETDLSTFSVRINYLNANGQGDVYTVDDVTIVGDNLTFSWLVGPTATAYKGNTKFNVCMKIVDSESYIQKEYNTTIATLPVLEGLETEERLVAYYSDILEQWKNQLFGIGDTEEANLMAKSEEEQENIAQKGIEVLATIPEDYQSTYEMANNAYRTRANAIVSTEHGEIICLDDSSSDPLRGLRVFGKTTQVTTTGKNMLQNVASTITVNGITFTVCSDGSILASGSATDNAFLTIGTVGYTAGTTYTLIGCPPGGSTDKYALYTIYGDETYAFDTGDGITFTPTEDITKNVSIKIVSGITVSNLLFRPMVYVASEEDATYEPYSGLMASPCPAWSQELDSVTDPTIRIHNSNLFGGVALGNKINSVSKSNTSVIDEVAGTVTYSGAGINSALLYEGPFKLNTRYTLILYGRNTTSTAAFTNLAFLHEDGTIGPSVPKFQTHGENSYATITSESDKTVKALIGKWASGEVTIYYDKCGLFEGVKTEADFEPYVEQTIVLGDRDVPGIPVESGGNYTDSNGQQWVCDEIDFERGVYVQRVVEKTLDGTQVYTQSNTQHDGVYSAYVSFEDICPQSGDVFMSDKFVCYPEDRYYTSAAEGIYTNPSATVRDLIIIRVSNEHGVTDIASLTAWLAANPVKVLCPLKTPIETELTAEELVVFGKIHSNYPNTTIINDVGATMEVKYNEDLKFYANEIMEDAAETVITQDKIQVAVDNWLSAHYSSAEGVSF